MVLTGANGAGKTNLLEAISLFSPGRGLRGASAPDFFHQGQTVPEWAVSAILRSPFGALQIGTGQERGNTRRHVKIAGKHVAQAELARSLGVLWLTPQMDGLFLDAASERRRYLDRLVFTFDPAHAGRVARYDTAMRERLRLLKQGNAPRPWLAALEKTAAETGVALAAARAELARNLNEAAIRQDDGVFPLAEIRVLGSVEQALTEKPAQEVEAWCCQQYEKSRAADTQAGRSLFGAHRSDLSIFWRARNMPASQGSTGEQKALLLSLTLAHAGYIGSTRGFAPILLLDEVAAHLDSERRAALFQRLLGLGGQVFMTGTDVESFASLSGQASFYHVSRGLITRYLS